jgi:hypothetical protein
MDGLAESGLLTTTQLVLLAKETYRITAPNAEMTDDQVRIVARWIGQHASDTLQVDGKVIFGRIGIGLMLFVTLSEFPEFHCKHGLGQDN